MKYAYDLFRILTDRNARVNEYARGEQYVSSAVESWIFPRKAILKAQ